VLDPELSVAGIATAYAPQVVLQLRDVMTISSPQLEYPEHLAPYNAAWERAQVEPVKLCFSAPVQHGKTVTTMHGLVMYAKARPGSSNAYSTYNFDRACTIQREVERIAYSVGLAPRGRLGHLDLNNGSRIRFAGCGSGQLTGYPISGMHVIDDPISDREQAESVTQRQTIWDWFLSVAQTRRHPGSSVVVMMSRWHADDLIGRCIRELGWPYLRIPAVCDSDDDPVGREIGAELWPSQRPLSFLEEFMADVFTWSSLYQGSPRPRGDSLFSVDPCWYDDLPAGGYRIAYGADLAYTESTRADYSVLLHGVLVPERGVFLTGIDRKQVQAPEFTAIMKAATQRRRGPILWYCSGTEKGVAQMVKRQAPLFRWRIVTADKYARAIPCAEKWWLAGKWHLPSKLGKGDKLPRWVTDYVDEMMAFTGVGDLHDDQVDASAALSWLAQVSSQRPGEINAHLHR